MTIKITGNWKDYSDTEVFELNIDREELFNRGLLREVIYEIKHSTTIIDEIDWTYYQKLNTIEMYIELAGNDIEEMFDTVREFFEEELVK